MDSTPLFVFNKLCSSSLRNAKKQYEGCWQIQNRGHVVSMARWFRLKIPTWAKILENPHIFGNFITKEDSQKSPLWDSQKSPLWGKFPTFGSTDDFL